MKTNEFEASNILSKEEIERQKHNKWNRDYRERHRDPNKPRKVSVSKEEQRRRKTERQKIWRSKNTELAKEHNARRKDAKYEFYCKKRREAVRYLGGICSICYYRDYDVLQIDHIAGDGGKERKEKGCGSTGFFNNIIKGLRPDLRLLCSYCNERAYRYGSNENDWPLIAKERLEREKIDNIKWNFENLDIDDDLKGNYVKN